VNAYLDSLRTTLPEALDAAMAQAQRPAALHYFRRYLARNPIALRPAIDLCEGSGFIRQAKKSGLSSRIRYAITERGRLRRRLGGVRASASGPGSPVNASRKGGSPPTNRA
jgi:hypothetical protein